jgi:hypothetical protein
VLPQDFLVKGCLRPWVCPNHDASHGHLLGQIFPLDENIVDGNVHSFNVRYNSTQHKLYVTVDGKVCGWKEVYYFNQITTNHAMIRMRNGSHAI